MNIQRLILAIVLPFSMYSQPEKMVTSTISEVTIFGVGAQVTRDVSMSLSVGVNEIVFENVSPLLDEKSIQFKTKSDLSILSMKHELRFDANSEESKKEIATLNQKLKVVAEEIKTKKNLLAITVNEEQVVMQNTSFQSWEGMNITQLEQGVDFVKNRLTTIKKEKQDLRRELDELKITKQKLINDLQEKRITEAKAKGVVVLKIESEKLQNIKAQLSYVVADAGWEPYYDLRVENVSKPLKIEYKAKVYQNTGEDWKGVNLTLSTGNPYEDAQLPQLNPWYLNFVSSNYYSSKPKVNNPQATGLTGIIRGTVIDQKTGESLPFANVVALNAKGELIAGSASDMDGSFMLDLKTPATRLDISFVGYHNHSTALVTKEQFYTVKLQEGSETLEEVMISYKPPTIKKNESITVRGAREEGTVYYIDGVKMRGNVSIPQAAISETEIITGGLPAQYGDSKGGVVYSRSRSYSNYSNDEFIISQNQVNLKFEVELPYDIPSDGEEYKVSIKEYEKEVSYMYRAVPKLNEHAFLTASIVDWETLNLMNGYAGIYLEGTYLGETYLNVEQSADTLQVDLGKDENIVVQRNSVLKKEGEKSIGKNKTEHFHYQIKVRNNKEDVLTLEIIDQYPVAANTDISVDKIENTGAKEEDKTGMLSWEFTLDPKEEKTIDLEYKVRYPKSKRVNTK